MVSQLKNVLEAVKPYVIVVGSYARGEHNSGSDVDMYIRRRSQEELDEDYLGELSEDYMPEVIDVLKREGIEWESELVGYVDAKVDGVRLEFATHFKLPKEVSVTKQDIFTVKMNTAVDDKELSSDEVNEEL